MLTGAIANLFRRYCDEPDTSFMSDNNLAENLKFGYAEFLNFVNEHAPTARIRATFLTLVGVQDYDLTQASITATVAGTPSVLGPNPNQDAGGGNWLPLGRMTRLQEVVEVDANNNLVRRFQVVPSDAQMNLWGVPTANTCMWKGDQLIFDLPINNTIILSYNYEQEVGLSATPGGVAVDQTDQTWVGAPITTAGEYLNDGMDAWHDIIALMAYAQYSIVDDSANQNVLRRLTERKKEFESYLQQRSSDSIRYVTPTVNPLKGYF